MNLNLRWFASILVFLITLTPVLAFGQDDDGTVSDETLVQALLVNDLRGTIAILEGIVISLRKEIETTTVALAASNRDKAEVERRLADKQVELDAANARLERLQSDFNAERELNKTHFDELLERMKSLETSTAKSQQVAWTPPAATVTPPAAGRPEPVEGPTPVVEQAVLRQPSIDPLVFQRVGYVNWRPSRPNPVGLPGLDWRQCSNCLTIRNVAQWPLRVRVVGLETAQYRGNVQVDARDGVTLRPGDELNFVHVGGDRVRFVVEAMSTTTIGLRPGRQCSHDVLVANFGADRVHELDQYSCQQ